MSDIYKLNDLNGLTVGKGQRFDDFAEVLDYLFENYPYKKVKEMLCFDSITDLAEYITDCNGEYDETETRDGWLLDALDGEDIDEEDPYAEHGDHMYDVAAGK